VRNEPRASHGTPSAVAFPTRIGPSRSVFSTRWPCVGRDRSSRRQSVSFSARRALRAPPAAPTYAERVIWRVEKDTRWAGARVRDVPARRRAAGPRGRSGTRRPRVDARGVNASRIRLFPSKRDLAQTEIQSDHLS
jgi:hypothetical protein